MTDRSPELQRAMDAFTAFVSAARAARPARRSGNRDRIDRAHGLLRACADDYRSSVVLVTGDDAAALESFRVATSPSYADFVRAIGGVS